MPSNLAPTFVGRWRRAVDHAGGRPFLIWEGADRSVRTWTYAEFDALVREVAATLTGLGVRRGSSVNVALSNSPAFVAIWLATLSLGGVLVPVDPNVAADELTSLLVRTRSTVGIGSTRRGDVYRAGCADIDGFEALLVDEDDVELAVLRTSAAGGRRVAARPRDIAAVMFTSGTTSQPKGVLVTQANYAFAGDVMAAAAAMTADDRFIVALPLFHANAQYYCFAAAISVGAAVVLVDRFSASRFVDQAAEHGATHASLFAAPMRMILAKQVRRPAHLRLRHVWYAQNVTEQQYVELADLFGCRPRQLYGMTETIPAVLTSNALDARATVMGDVTLGCRVALRPVAGPDEVREDGASQILVGGRRGIELFAGYLDDPVTTEAAFAGRWFLTGDYALLDERGRHVFAGRGADTLKVAGENVSVVEVESVLAAHPDVFEAAVVGAPDPMRDEVPVAFVVLKAGSERTTEDDLLGWCAERLSPAKRPRRLTFVDELPRTSVGKIRKFLLQRIAVGAGDPGSGEEDAAVQRQ
ncbi:MAG: putative crotonobetaine/carnitine-CoA ligase [Frankiales bacterium]|nr:putative crotonobetaine/carnitine-CoA ligase [Frankiales bacterium]